MMAFQERKKSFASDSLWAKVESDISFSKYLADPSYYTDGNQEFILIATKSYDSESKAAGIYQYNLNTQEIKLLYEYEQGDYDFVSHGQFVDAENDTFYIFGGNYNLFLKFDLKTKNKPQFIDTIKIPDGCKYLSSIAYINTPTARHIHIINNGHYKYDVQKEQFIRCKIFIDEVNKNCSDIFYNELNDKLMMICPNGHIYDCQYDDTLDNEGNINLKWSLNCNQLPDTQHVWFILCILKSIIFVWEFSTHQIWCVDLLDNKVIKTKHQVIPMTDMVSFKTKDNFIHILDIYDGLHYKVLLLDLIPDEIIKSHLERYRLLVAGYVKQEIENDLVEYIPLSLIDLIARFYPAFF